MQPVLVTVRPLDPALLTSNLVGRGQVWRRVIHTGVFYRTLLAAAIGCAAVHVLFGWLVATCWGHCEMPSAVNGSACLVPPGDQETRGISLVSEVMVDSLLTTFFVSGGQLPARINDVKNGRLPLVATDVRALLAPACPLPVSVTGVPSLRAAGVPSRLPPIDAIPTLCGARPPGNAA